MSKSDTFENDYMKFVFNNVGIAGVGDTNGLLPSATAGNFWLALHVGDPGEASTQTTNETAYTGYARLAVARTAAGFTVTGSTVNLTANADFPVCTANPGGAITHFSIGAAQTGTGKLLYSGTLTPNITMAPSVVPRITTAANLVTED